MMNTVKFPLSSEHLEILCAFEQTKGLRQLSEILSKDATVISKKLKKISELAPVLKKVSGKWEITALGRNINDISRKFAVEISKSLPSEGNLLNEIHTINKSKKLLLMIVNAQRAFFEPVWGLSSTPSCQKNIQKILRYWRQNNAPIVHVKHTSADPNHPFFMDKSGSKFMEGLEPKKGELVIEKSSASAFTNSNLGINLENNNINSIVLTGFTASECVDATAKSSADLGYKNYVVTDATATFQMPGPGEKKYSANEIHDFTMTRLNKNFAEIINSNFLVNAVS